MPAILSWDEARADCVVTVSPNFVCSGTTTTNQAISANNISVTTAPGFNLSTYSAFQIFGNGAISYVDANASPINVTNSSGLTLTSQGDAGGTAGGITINTGADIFGGSGGISAFNQFGAGSISVTSTGLTQGGAYTIYAVNNATGQDIFVSSGAASNSGAGIFAENLGHGSTTVIANGALSTASGVLAYNSGTDLSVTTNAAVTAAFGGREGIHAANYGTGFTTVTANAAVTDSFVYGILAIDGTTTTNANGTLGSVTGGLGTNVTVNATQVSSRGTGIYAVNSGAGGGSTGVTATGDVTGGSGYGVLAINGDATFGTTGFASGVTAGASTNLTASTAGVSSGRGVFAVNAGTGATSVTATGDVTGTAGFGLLAINGTATFDSAGFVTGVATALSTNLSVSAARVTGSTTGIYIDNEGTGGISSVTATGTVTGTAENGIHATSRGGLAGNPAATTLTVNAATVNGGINGIVAQNLGYGSTSVIASGPVAATIGTGIDGYTANTALTINAAAVSGGANGIVARNDGNGVTSITATDAVAGGSGTGIFALTRGAGLAPADPGLAISAMAVSGGMHGIYADNEGGGATSIAATGVTAGGSAGVSGIFAFNAATATNLTVSAGAVTGGNYGLVAANNGTGATNVTVTGDVQGNYAGLAAVNGQVAVNDIVASNPFPLGAGGTDLFVSAAGVSGGSYGIYAVNNGTGATNVTATGAVSGQAQNGILAINDFSATSMTVHAAGVSGATGISVQNDGSGAVLVSASGPVVGTAGNGIIAFNGSAGTSLTVTATAVTGAQRGIDARNFGTGPLSIATSGIVEGGVSAISATSGGQPVSITTSGLVRNLSQLSSSLAIETSGSPASYTNNGGLLGTVAFGANASSFNNNAIWNTAGGTNQLGGGASQLLNAAGVSIIAAANSGIAETTSFNGVGSFVNRGRLSLQDGGAGDIVSQTGGNAHFEKGSTLAIDVNAAGQADRFVTNGTANLTNTKLDVNVVEISRGGARYTVLTADGGLTGTFDTITGLPPQTNFLAIKDVYDATNAYLQVIQFRSLASAGSTPNQIATGRGLDNLFGNAAYDAVTGLPTDQQARAAFDSLSGEVHASAKTALIEESHFIRDAANDRLRQSFAAVGAQAMPAMSFTSDVATTSPAANAMAYAMATKAPSMTAYAPAPTWAIWGQGFGSWGHTDGDGNAARLDRSTGGVVSGFDAIVAETWRLGVMGGYSHTTFNVRDRSSSGQSDNYHVGAYGGTQWGALGFRTGAAYTWHDITTTRSVAFPGFADNMRADYSAGTTQVFGELGYRVDTRAIALEPFANLAYVNLRTEGFTERGGAAALTSTASTADATFTTLGVRASTNFMVANTAVTARSTLGWRHAFDDVTPLSTFAFAGGNAFNIAGVPVARDAAILDVGVDFAIARDATIGVSYNGQFGSNAADQSVRGNFTVRF